jgi:hypothetical protein
MQSDFWVAFGAVLFSILILAIAAIGIIGPLWL